MFKGFAASFLRSLPRFSSLLCLVQGSLRSKQLLTGYSWDLLRRANLHGWSYMELVNSILASSTHNSRLFFNS